jgi:hypothetical protein
VGSKRSMDEPEEQHAADNVATKRARVEGPTGQTELSAAASTVVVASGSAVAGDAVVSNSLQGQGQRSHGGTPPAAKCEMNLWDVAYQRDTRPLVSCRSAVAVCDTVLAPLA